MSWQISIKYFILFSNCSRFLLNPNFCCTSAKVASWIPSGRNPLGKKFGINFFIIYNNYSKIQQICCITK